MVLDELVPRERDERLFLGALMGLSILFAAIHTAVPFDSLLLTDLLTPVIMAAILVSVYRIVRNWKGILAYHFRVIGSGVMLFIVTWTLQLIGTDGIGPFTAPYSGNTSLIALFDLLALGSLVYIAYGFSLLAKEPRKMHFTPENRE